MSLHLMVKLNTPSPHSGKFFSMHFSLSSPPSPPPPGFCTIFSVLYVLDRGITIFLKRTVKKLGVSLEGPSRKHVNFYFVNNQAWMLVNFIAKKLNILFRPRTLQCLIYQNCIIVFCAMNSLLPPDILN
jgi:hypothetical protein